VGVEWRRSSTLHEPQVLVSVKGRSSPFHIVSTFCRFDILPLPGDYRAVQGWPHRLGARPRELTGALTAAPLFRLTPPLPSLQAGSEGVNGLVSSASARHLRGDEGGAAAAARALMAGHPGDRRALHTVISIAALASDAGLAREASRALQASGPPAVCSVGVFPSVRIKVSIKGVRCLAWFVIWCSARKHAMLRTTIQFLGWVQPDLGFAWAGGCRWRPRHPPQHLTEKALCTHHALCTPSGFPRRGPLLKSVDHTCSARCLSKTTPARKRCGRAAVSATRGGGGPVGGAPGHAGDGRSGLREQASVFNTRLAVGTNSCFCLPRTCQLSRRNTNRA